MIVNPINRRRKAAGITQADLGVALGVGPARAQHIDRLEGKLTESQYAALAYLFDVSIEVLRAEVADYLSERRERVLQKAEAGARP